MSRNDQQADQRRREVLARLNEIRDHLRRKLADYPVPCADRAFLEDELAVLNILAKAERDGKGNLSAVFRPRTTTPPDDPPSDIWLG